jgi:hypothetical protein
MGNEIPPGGLSDGITGISGIRGLNEDELHLRMAAQSDAELTSATITFVALSARRSAAGELGLTVPIDNPVSSKQLGPELVELRDYMNAPPQIDSNRIFVWATSRIEEFAGIARHEMEHVKQMQHFAQLYELHELASDLVEYHTRGSLDGGTLYNAIPIEHDANAAASKFLRREFGDKRINQLLDASATNIALLRPDPSLGNLETLPARMLNFFRSLQPSCDNFSADVPGGGLSFRQLLRMIWPELAQQW